MDKYLIISRFGNKDEAENCYNIVFSNVDEAVLKLQKLINSHGRYTPQSHLLLINWDDVLEFDYPSLGYAEHDPKYKQLRCVSRSIDYDKDWEEQTKLEDKKWSIIEEIAARIKLVPPKKPYVYGGEG